MCYEVKEGLFMFLTESVYFRYVRVNVVLVFAQEVVPCDSLDEDCQVSSQES